MGLLDDIRGERESDKRVRCGVALIMQRLDKADREDLADALVDDTVFAAEISRALTRRGHPISDQAVARHRRGVCACPR